MKNYSLSIRIILGIAILTFLALPLLSACRSAENRDEAHKGRLTISGAFALYPLVVEWADKYQSLYPDVRIDITAGGAGKGMADTLAGAVDIGMISREIRPEELDQGAFAIAVAKDAVFPVISANNPHLESILEVGSSDEMLAKVYLTGEITTWGALTGNSALSENIHVYTRSDSCGAAEEMVKFLGGKAQEELLGVGVNSDPGILEAVIKDPLGLGYNNLNYVFDFNTGKVVEGAIILPMDINKNGQIDPEERYEIKQAAIDAVASGFYPSPPARELLLATKGQPQGVARDFIAWILTEGQQYVSSTGYVPLSEDRLLLELDKLE